MADKETQPVASRTTPSAFLGGSNPFRAMQDEMDRMFHAFSMPRMKWNSPTDLNGGVMGLRVDIAETDDEIEIKADLPGIPEENVEVTLEDDILCLRAEKKSESEKDDKNWKVVERSYGFFERQIRVPQGLDAEQVQATFDKGVLTVTMPKPPTPEPAAKRIAVKSTD